MFKRWYFGLIFVSVFFSANSQDWQNSPYFNTKFLSQYDAVAHRLITHDGFQDGFFTTEDGVSINYLWLVRPNASYTMILCSGFWPGRKEGLATFYAMLSDNCNILLFDARGHAQSTGRFWSQMWRYGCNEYKDIIGAVAWAYNQRSVPIVIYGVCSGAFNAAHAVLQMQKRNEINRYNVRGLVFDSGWSSVAEVAHTALPSESERVLNKKIKTGSDMVNSLLCKMVLAVIRGGVTVGHYCFVRPISWGYKNQTDLIEKIDGISIPIMYIHAKDDTYAPIKAVKQLADKTPRKTCWWITQPSKHACHYLKFKELYRSRLLDFVQSVCFFSQKIS